MSTKLSTITEAHSVLMPEKAGKDRASRLRRFCDWLTETDRGWHDDPDLARYRDYLLENGRVRGDGDGLAPSTVRAHVSTVRARYDDLLSDNAVRDALEVAVRRALDQNGDGYGPADVEALVNRKLARLRNATDPNKSEVAITTAQDVADSEHYRLTTDQAAALLHAPGTDTIRGLRDTAILALMIATGIRAAEAAALQIDDLRQYLDGELALHVRHGKGDKARLIPYGAMDWVLVIVDAWTSATAISRGPVLRGFYRGSRSVRSEPITTRAIQDVLSRYPVSIAGELITLTPHDLRRTYARLMYQNNIDLLSIQQNLGHADSKTTLGYIGAMDAEARRAPALVHFDVSNLYHQADFEHNEADPCA
jgi:site-specific recombinase XerD